MRSVVDFPSAATLERKSAGRLDDEPGVSAKSSGASVASPRERVPSIEQGQDLIQEQHVKDCPPPHTAAAQKPWTIPFEDHEQRRPSYRAPL